MVNGGRTTAEPTVEAGHLVTALQRLHSHSSNVFARKWRDDHVGFKALENKHLIRGSKSTIYSLPVA